MDPILQAQARRLAVRRQVRADWADRYAGPDDGKATGDSTEWTGLFIRLPEALANQFPQKESGNDKSPPHATLLYVGNVKGREAEFVETCQRVVAEEFRSPVTAVLGELDYFTHAEKERRVAILPIRFSHRMAELRDKIKSAVEDLGIEVQDSWTVYRPHTTLAYLGGLDSTYEGVSPSGSWTFSEIEIWGMPQIHKLKVGTKVAARPIKIDKGKIAELTKKIMRELPKHLKFRDPEDALAFQRGYNPNSWGFKAGRYMTTDVRGNSVGVKVVFDSRNKNLTFRDSRKWIVGGGVRHMGFNKGEIAIKMSMTVTLDAGKPVQAILANLSKIEREVYSVLIHEVTHLRDILRAGEGSDHFTDAKDYHNQPTETRAFMQQIVHEIIEYIHKEGKAGNYWAGVEMYDLTAALEHSVTWDRVRKTLNPRQKKTMLKGVYTGMQDELPKLQGLYPGDGDDWDEATSRLAKKFTLNVGDPVLTGKYLNSKGFIIDFKKGDKGDPMVVVETMPDKDGKTKKKDVKLFKLRFDESRAKKASGMVFYHTSDRELPVGTKIRPQAGGHSKGDIEDAFERVRRADFPDRPPRVGSVFVCPSREGFCNGRWRKHVYEVEIQGARKVFWANAEMWTEASFRPDEAESYANSYWKYPTSPTSRHFFKEVLVHGGTVTVVRRVDTSKKAARPIPLDKGYLRQAAVMASKAVLKACETETKRRRGAWALKRLSAFRGGQGLFLSLPDLTLGKVLKRGQGLVPSQAQVPFYIEADKNDKTTGGRRKLLRKAEWASAGNAQWLRLYLYGGLTSAYVEANLPALEKELYSALIHEMTHGVELFDRPGDESNQTRGLAPDDYANNPLEFRAFMQQIADEVLESVQGGLPFQRALQESSTFKQIGPHLNPRNRKTMIKGVWTHWQDSLAEGGQGRVAALYQDQLPGGLGDDKVPSDFDPKQIAKGVKIEMEHTEDSEVAREIAVDHLTEDPHYYEKLEQIEKHARIAELWLVSRTPESKVFQQDLRAKATHIKSALRGFKALTKAQWAVAAAEAARVEFPGKDKASIQRRGRYFVPAVIGNTYLNTYLDKYIGTVAQDRQADGWRRQVLYQLRNVALKPGYTLKAAVAAVAKQAEKGFLAIEMAVSQGPLRESLPEKLRAFLPRNIVVRVDDDGKIEQITDRFENEHLTLGKKIEKQHLLIRKYNSIAKKVKQDLKGGDEKIKLAAIITAILMETGIRPGKAGNAAFKTVGGEKVEIETFGAVTLGPGHVSFIRGNFATLEFVGKKGGVNTAQLQGSAIIQVLQDYVAKALKGGSKYVFVTESGERFGYGRLKRYFDKNFKGIAPTDFRKLKATETLLDELRAEQKALYAEIRGFAAAAKDDLKQQVTDAIVETLTKALGKAQAALSHDSPYTTVEAYINPEVILGFLSTGRAEKSLRAAVLKGVDTLAFNPQTFIDLALEAA